MISSQDMGETQGSIFLMAPKKMNQGWTKDGSAGEPLQ